MMKIQGAVSSALSWLIYDYLFHQQHLAGGAVVTGGEAIEVQSAGSSSAFIVSAVPDHAMVSAGLPLVDQSTYLLTPSVVDIQFYWTGQ